MLQICVFPLTSFEVRLKIPTAVQNVNNTTSRFSSEYDNTTFSPLLCTKIKRIVDGYFTEEYLEEECFIIQVKDLVGVCLEGKQFLNYLQVMHEFCDYCHSNINSQKYIIEQTFSIYENMSIDRNLSRINIPDVVDSLVHREQMNINNVYYLEETSGVNWISFKLTDNSNFYHLNIQKMLIYDSCFKYTQQQFLNCCVINTPFSIYTDTICKQLLDNNNNNNKNNGHVFFHDVKKNGWYYNVNKSLIICNKFIFKHFLNDIQMLSSCNFITHKDQLKHIDITCLKNTIICENVLLSYINSDMRVKIRNRFDVSFITHGYLQGQSEIAYRASQKNNSYNTVINFFQIHWPKVIYKGSRFIHTKIYTLFTDMLSFDILFVFRDNPKEIYNVLQRLMPTINLWYLMIYFDFFVRIFPFKNDNTDFDMWSLTPSIREQLNMTTTIPIVSVHEYISELKTHLEDGECQKDFITSLNEIKIMSSTCPVCMNTISTFNQIVGLKCGHVICTSCFIRQFNLHSGTQRCCICRNQISRMMLIAKTKPQITDTEDITYEHFVQRYGTYRGFIFWQMFQMSLQQQKQGIVLQQVKQGIVLQQVKQGIPKVEALQTKIPKVEALQAKIVFLVERSLFYENILPTLRCVFSTSDSANLLNSLKKLNVYYNDMFESDEFTRIYNFASQTSIYFITFHDDYYLNSYEFYKNRFHGGQITHVFIIEQNTNSNRLNALINVIQEQYQCQFTVAKKDNLTSQAFSSSSSSRFVFSAPLRLTYPTSPIIYTFNTAMTDLL